MKTNQTKIEIYMRDLRKHALDEYEDLYQKEQELIRQGKNAEGKKKRKKRKRKNKNASANAGEEEDATPNNSNSEGVANSQDRKADGQAS